MAGMMALLIIKPDIVKQKKPLLVCQERLFLLSVLYLQALDKGKMRSTILSGLLFSLLCMNISSHAALHPDRTSSDGPNPDKRDKCVNEIIFLPKNARKNF
jgi:hypothetical protein